MLAEYLGTKNSEFSMSSLEAADDKNKDSDNRLEVGMDINYKDNRETRVFSNR